MLTKTEDAQIRAKGKTSKLIRNWRRGTKRQKQPREKCLCLMAPSKIFLQCVNIFEHSSKQLKHSYFPFDKLKHAFQIWLQSPEGSSDRRCTSFRLVLYEYTMPPKTQNCQRYLFPFQKWHHTPVSSCSWLSALTMTFPRSTLHHKIINRIYSFEPLLQCFSNFLDWVP